MRFKYPLIEDLSWEGIQNSIRNDRLQNLQQLDDLREKLIDFYECHQTPGKYLGDYGFRDRERNEYINDLPWLSNSLTKRVINRTSLVYKSPPSRVLVNKSDTLIEDDDYNRFIDENPQVNIALKKAERYYNLLHNILLRPVYDPEAKEWRFYIETDYKPYFAEGNPLWPVGYDILIKTDNASSNVNDQVWMFWSKDMYFFHNENKAWSDPALGRDEGDLTNPYGDVMPLIDFTNYPVNEYWQLGAKDLVEANQMLNIMLLNGMYGFHFESFDQLYMTSDKPEEARNVQMGPFKVALLPTDSVMSSVTFDVNFTGMSDWLKFYVNTVLSNYGMRAEWSEDGGGAVSGISLKIKNMELLEMREDAVDFFRVKEQELFRVMKSMLKYHSDLGYKIPEDAALQIDFQDIEFPKEPAEYRDEWEWKVSKNLATWIDYLMWDNPDLSPEEAERKFQENVVSNRTLRGLGQPGATREAIIEVIEE